MIHPLVGLIVFKVMLSRGEVFAKTPVLAAIVAFCVSFCLAIVSYYCFEVRARRWIVARPLGGALAKSQLRPT